MFSYESRHQKLHLHLQKPTLSGLVSKLAGFEGISHLCKSVRNHFKFSVTIRTMKKEREEKDRFHKQLQLPHTFTQTRTKKCAKHQNFKKCGGGGEPNRRRTKWSLSISDHSCNYEQRRWWNHDLEVHTRC